jgi:hypothetical protein
MTAFTYGQFEIDIQPDKVVFQGDGQELTADFGEFLTTTVENE